MQERSKTIVACDEDNFDVQLDDWYASEEYQHLVKGSETYHFGAPCAEEQPYWFMYHCKWREWRGTSQDPSCVEPEESVCTECGECIREMEREMEFGNDPEIEEVVGALECEECGGYGYLSHPDGSRKPCPECCGGTIDMEPENDPEIEEVVEDLEDGESRTCKECGIWLDCSVDNMDQWVCIECQLPD